MKKLITILLIVLYYIVYTPSTHAVTPTASPSKTPTPTETSIIKNADDRINKLRERIASTVAELNLVERRGVIGTVTDVSQTQITISDIHNNTRFVDVDELTKFASPSAKDTFGISDVTKGTKIGVLGLYNKQSRRILSRFVDVVVMPTTIHGTVASTDEDEFSIEIQTDNGTVTVDVETITKTNSYDNEGESTRSGFSKIENDMRIVVVGFPVRNQKNRYVASRILLFPDLAKNPRIQTSSVTPTQPVATESSKTSTKSAR